jgi:hypothetical protein
MEIPSSSSVVQEICLRTFVVMISYLFRDLVIIAFAIDRPLPVRLKLSMIFFTAVCCTLRT